MESAFKRHLRLRDPRKKGNSSRERWVRTEISFNAYSLLPLTFFWFNTAASLLKVLWNRCRRLPLTNHWRIERKFDFALLTGMIRFEDRKSTRLNSSH